MPNLKHVSESLASAFVLGGLDKECLIAHASGRFFRNSNTPKWLEQLAEHIEKVYSDNSVRPTTKEVAKEIRKCNQFLSQWDKRKVHLGTMRSPVSAKMFTSRWNVPAATNLYELARLIELDIDDLGWLTQNYSKTDHYHLRWHAKKGTPKSRLIEIPKPLLKETQRIILRKILDPLPIHENALGFCPGKSIFDYVEPHSGGKDLVLKMDLKDFFPSISSGRVFNYFMMLGYPEIVAGKLADLCTHRVESSDLAGANIDSATTRYLTRPHLPQGAPTSPTLANLCAFRLDCRLSGLANSLEANYTRYADDLLFSGGPEFKRRAKSFHQKVLVIILEEGFRINTRKTRFMRPSQRQSATGLVFNDRPNLSRKEFDRLKAILHNCQKHGPKSQNRENLSDFQAHLQGRLNWATRANPEKAEKLWRIFEQISWSD